MDAMETPMAEDDAALGALLHESSHVTWSCRTAPGTVWSNRQVSNGANSKV